MTAILQPPSAFMPASPNTPITTLLARIPLFSGLAPEELVRIAQGTREIVAAKGKTLFHRGDQPTGFPMGHDLLNGGSCARDNGTSCTHGLKQTPTQHERVGQIDMH